MKTLERSQVDGLVRELEAGAYGLALEFMHDREAAADALAEAFGRAAPFFPRLPPERLKARVDGALRRQLAADGWASASVGGIAAPVSESLHTRLVDVVEERQHDEPVGNRKLLYAAVAGALLLVGTIGYAIIRIDALTAARPLVAETSPSVNAREVAVEGTLVVRFSRPPWGKPSILVLPAGGSLDQSAWDGHELDVNYSGFKLATTYTVTVAANYASKYGDLGHFVQQWRFTTEGYPIVVKLDPAGGATGTFRTGQLSIDFSHRPTVDPVITISPPDAALQPGLWLSTTWIVPYSGLKPLTSYTATVAVDFGEPGANIHRSWSFSTEIGPPPLGVPVIWYVEGSRNGPPPAVGPQRLVALDWNGNVVGTTYVNAPNRQTWNGSLLTGQDGNFVDAAGTVVGTTGTFGAIADDSRTLCELADSNGQPARSLQWLFVGPVGGALRKVAPVTANSPESNIGLIGCSARTNHALLIQSKGQGIASVSVLALDSGRVVYQHSYSTDPSSIILSRDLRYIAEQIPTLNSQGDATSWTTVVRRISDGAVLASLSNQVVLAFSWDDRRLVTAGAPGSGRNEIDLLDWQSGKVLWQVPFIQVPNSFAPAYATAQPNGSSVAVALGAPSVNGDVNQLWLVSADGAAKQVLSTTFYAMFFYAY